MRPILPLALAAFALGWSPSGGGLEPANLRQPTLKGWEEYVRAVQARVETELQSTKPFLVLERLPRSEQLKAAATLSAGSVFITHVPGPTLRAPAPDIPDGLVHHWLGVVRIPSVRLDDVLGFVQRYDDSARFFSDVIASKLVQRDGDDFEVFLKLKREKTVAFYKVTKVYNSTHRVGYRRLDASHAASRSVATRIAELSEAGQPTEREEPIGHDAGYLWRLNSYWRFVEADDGVTVECESLSLSRDIPTGLGWMVGGVVESIARESVERTLGSIRNGIKKRPGDR
jgi:hypothetical protein